MKKCKLPYKTAEANAKAALRTRGAIDKFLNITDLATFQKENKSLTEHGKRAYGLDRTWFYSEQYGTKAVPNKQAFNEVDDINGVIPKKRIPPKGEGFAQEAIPKIKDKRMSKIERTLFNYLDSINVETKIVKNLQKELADRNLPSNIVAVADILHKAVFLEDKKYNTEQLAKKVAIFAIEFMGSTAHAEASPLITKAIDKIHTWEKYDALYDYYSDHPLYKGNERKIKKEILSSLIAETIIKNKDRRRRINQSKKLTLIEDIINRVIKMFDSLWKSKYYKMVDNYLKHRGVQTQGVKKVNLRPIDGIINEIVDDILFNDVSKIINDGDRKRKGDTKISLKKLLENNPSVSNIYHKLNSMGFMFTGSPALSNEGTVYRESNEGIHDLDWQVPPHLEKNWLELVKTTFPDISYKINERTNKAQVFKKGDKITHTLMIDGMPVDFFISINPPTRTNKFGDMRWQDTFEKKMEMGRHKDIRDLIDFKTEHNDFFSVPSYVYTESQRETSFAQEATTTDVAPLHPEKLNSHNKQELQRTVEYELMNEGDRELEVKAGQPYIFLSGRELDRFDKLIDKKGRLPKEFYVTKRVTKYKKRKGSNEYDSHNEYIDFVYVKANNHPKSNLYHVLNREEKGNNMEGEVIAENVRLIHIQKDVKESIADSYGMEFKPTEVFSANRSIGFTLYRLKPSKAKYVAQAKQYLYSALKMLNPEHSKLHINLDKIEGLLDAFPEEIWEYINTTLEPEDRTTVQARISVANQIKFNLPKRGLVTAVEKIIGKKLIGVRFKNRDRSGYLEKLFGHSKINGKWGDIIEIDPKTMTTRELRASIGYYLTSIGHFKESSAKENVGKYAEHFGIDQGRLEKLVFGSTDEALEHITHNHTGNSDTIELSKWREKIRTYDWQTAELFKKPYDDFEKHAKDRIAEKFKDKKLANGMSHLDFFFSGNFNWMNINFNNISGTYYMEDMETPANVGVSHEMRGHINPFVVSEYKKPKAGEHFLEDVEVFNRLAAVLHEPAHALHALSYGSPEELALRGAFEELKNTEFGKRMMSEVFDRIYNNKVLTDDTMYKEFVAFTTQLMLYPPQWITKTEQRSNDIYEFIEKVQTLQDKTYLVTETKKQPDGRTITQFQEVEDIKIGFLQTLRNYFVKALHKIIPLSKKFFKLVETSRIVNKEVLDTVLVEEQSTRVETKKLPSEIRQAKDEFLTAMEEFRTAINTLMAIDGKALSPDKLREFFTDNSYAQTADTKTKPVVESTHLSEQEAELNGKLKKLLHKLGFKYEAVEKILDEDGNEIPAIAKANGLHKLVQVVEGLQDRTTLPEEVATIILSLMGTDHPLVKSMMSEVENTDVYKEVLERYGEEYTGFEDMSQHNALKIEAITKIIAQKLADNFSDSKPEVESRIGRWFNRLWKWVSDAFSTANSGEYGEVVDAFYLTAEKILNEDLKDLQAEPQFLGEFYQLKPDPTAVDNILRKLDETQKRILEPTYDKNDPNATRYRDMFDGFVRYVTNRPSDKQSRLFEKTMGKEVAKAMNESARSKMQRDFGIKLHELSQKVIDALVNGGTKPQKPLWFPQDSWKDYLKGVVEVVEQAQELQNRIDPDGKAIFKTENRIFDPSKKHDIAGSIDLLVIFSDATAARFDWKFINYKSKIDPATKEREYDPDSITPIKERSYDLQASEYDRMLREVYGVKKIRISRVVPANVQFSFNRNSKTYKLHSVELGNNREHLKQVPLANESISFDEELDKLLTSLKVLRERLSDRASEDFMNEKLQKKLKIITNQVRALQLNHDIVPTLQIAQTLISVFNSKKGINDPENDQYLNDEELVEIARHLLLYSKLGEYTHNIKAKLPDDVNETLKTIKSDIESGLKDARTMMVTRLREHARNEDILGFTNKDGSLRAQLPVTNKDSFFKYMHRFDQPIMKMLAKAVDEINDGTRMKTDVLAKQIAVHNKALEDWGRSNGYKGTDILKHIINPNTGNLIGRYTREFYKKHETAAASQDLKWMKANLEYTDERKAMFEERKEERFQHYAKVYAEDPQKLDFIKENWLNKNDPSRESAWYTKDNFYLTVKEPKKWESDKWKFMQNNKALKDFYEFHKEKMVEFDELLPRKIQANFVANVHKDMVDQLFEQGVFTKSGWKGLAASFLQSFQVREGDEAYGMVDPETHRKKMNIPVLYIDPILDIGGSIDNSQKSLNLTRSLLLFGTMAYNYEAASQQEARVSMMREVLEFAPVHATSTFGKPTYKAGKAEVIEGDKKAIEVFDKYAEYALYGRKIQDHDTAFENKMIEKLSERLSKKGVDRKTLEAMKLSGNKMWRAAITFHSMKTLGLNAVSGIGGFAGALGNTFISGAKQGAYYNKDIMGAVKSKITRNKKHKLFVDFFEVSQENYNHIKADKLSVNKGAKWLTKENIFWLHRGGDEVVDDLTLEAMSKNYGVDVDGKIKKLSRIKNNPKSLWDTAKITEEGISFENVTVKELNRYRRMVKEIAARNKGNSSHENINLIQTTMLGKTVMQFKSWMPAMINERFGEARYNDILDEIELGRFRVAFGELLQEGVVTSATKFAQLGLEVLSAGIFKPYSKGNANNYNYHLNAGNSRHAFAKYLKENSHMLEKYSEQELYQMFVETKVEQLRAFAAELRAYIISYGFMAGIVALFGGEGDDEDTKVFKQFMKILDRAQLELGVFLNPNEYASFAKSLVPLVGLATDIINLAANTVDEIKDIFWIEEGRDWKGPRFKYTIKMIPVIKGVADLFTVIDLLEEWDSEDE